MSDLDKLIAAVEAGDKWSEAQYAVFGNGTDLVYAYQAAFDGSLDAALRLHETLLPGSFPGISQNIHSGQWYAWVKSSWHLDAKATTAAPALLLAILRAMKGETK